MSTWNPMDLSKMVLPLCHTFVQFYVKNGELSTHLHQRSTGMRLGVTFNVASHSLLMYMLARVTKLKVIRFFSLSPLSSRLFLLYIFSSLVFLQPGDFVHTMGDYHVYFNHVNTWKKQIGQEPRQFPKLRVVRDVMNIYDSELLDYHPHDKIYMKMVVWGRIRRRCDYHFFANEGNEGEIVLDAYT